MRLIPLREAQDPSQVGGKAAALGSLLRAGQRAPDGVVIPKECFEAHLDDSGRRAEIDALVAQVPHADPLALAGIAAEIEACLAEVPLKPELARALGQAWAEMGSPTVVVRSSAVGEDSASASFAGQLDSFLHVESEEALAAQVRRCWRSFYSARALAYRHATGLPLAGMGVIVQPQVEGVVSGVAFTQAPSAPGRVLVEHCAGGCEALVSGEIDPLSASVDRAALAASCAEAATELLPAAQLQALVETALALEAHFGAPQDIEWTLDPEGQLHLLQSRPITTSAAPPPAPEVAVFSNANINENYPDPVVPLLQSLAKTSYYYYFRNIGVAYGFAPRRLEAMEEALRGIVGVHGQRLYYDVSNIHAVLRMAPSGELFAEWFNRFVGVTATTEARERDLTWARGRAGRLGEAAELARMVASVTRQYTTLTAQVEAFEARVTDYAARTTHEALDPLGVDALVERLAAFIDIRCHRWIGAALADGACMVCCGALERFLGAHFEEPGDVLLHGLLRGLPDIVSSEPPRQLWLLSRRLREDAALRALIARPTPEVLDAMGWDGRRLSGELPFAALLQGFLDDWGFRCTGELMLTTESFQERPEAVIDMLRSYAGMDGEGPDEAIARQAADRVAQTEQLAASLSRPRRRVFSALLRATGRSLSLRERARLKQALLYRRFRRVVLDLSAKLHQAGALEHPDDALFMTWAELLALKEGAQPPRYAIASRRRTYEEERQWPAPPPRILLPRSERWTPPREAATAEAFEVGDRLEGLAAAAGQVTARATVARGQQDFHLVAAGDVLVAPQTDPGWATVLFLVRGLVMERGGMLSHGAIIAREFGIPSVVGVAHATTRIPQGCTVTVNGDEGHVHVLD